MGVGAWRYAAPTLRGHLARLCRQFGFSEARLCDLRGHLLPMRRPAAPIVRGPALLLGDAAGLVGRIAEPLNLRPAADVVAVDLQKDRKIAIGYHSMKSGVDSFSLAANGASAAARPVRVEELAARAVDALVRVRAEAIPLRLYDSCREAKGQAHR